MIVHQHYTDEHYLLPESGFDKIISGGKLIPGDGYLTRNVEGGVYAPIPIT